MAFHFLASIGVESCKGQSPCYRLYSWVRTPNLATANFAKVTMQSRKAQEKPTHKKLVLTGLSAMVAETATFPIDIIKTRLQLHGHGGSSNLTTTGSAVKVAVGILRNEGFLGLYQGLSPAIIRHLIYTPIRIVGYENLKRVNQQ